MFMGKKGKIPSMQCNSCVGVFNEVELYILNGKEMKCLYLLK